MSILRFPRFLGELRQNLTVRHDPEYWVVKCPHRAGKYKIGNDRDDREPVRQRSWKEHRATQFRITNSGKAHNRALSTQRVFQSKELKILRV